MRGGALGVIKAMHTGGEREARDSTKVFFFISEELKETQMYIFTFCGFFSTSGCI